MHERTQVRQPQILHSMNQNFAGHAEFEFGELLFSVSVLKKQNVQSAAKATAASFLPKAIREGETGMTVLSKCFAAFLISSVLILPALAQTSSTADPKASGGTSATSTPPAQEPTAPAPPTWSVGPID